MVDAALATAIYGGSDIVKAIDGDGLGLEEFSTGREIFEARETQHPVEKVLAKNAGINLPVSKAGTASGSLEEHSAARFEKVCLQARSIFARNPELAEEVIAIAKQMLTDARASALAIAAS
jgi:hypothetical protein